MTFQTHNLLNYLRHEMIAEVISEEPVHVLLNPYVRERNVYDLFSN
jgi:hypothetical protein